jgi:hypothetical protein
MVMVLSRNRMIKFAIICFFTISGLLFLTKDSFASNSTVVGFMIEADQMEGTIQGTELVTGDTADQQGRPMLELRFGDISAQGMVIKKIVNTPNGIVTINMTSKDTAVFNNVKIKVTNAVFSKNYKPESGNIGFEDVKLLAHMITSDSTSLPQFDLSFNEGSQLQLDSLNAEGLIQLKASLESLLGSTPQ